MNAPVGVSDDTIRLVVNADDFGVSEQVNWGIARAHREGIVTAASLMAVGRAFEHAVQLSRTMPALDVGVHLTLVAGRPLLCGRSSLAGSDGCFPSSAGAFTLRWLTGRVRRVDVEREWSVQIKRVLDSGLRVSHLDSHQHVHVLPGLLDLACKLAAGSGIPFVRAPVEGLRAERLLSARGLSRNLGAITLRLLWAIGRPGTTRRYRHRYLRFIGFQDGGRLDLQRLRRVLSVLRPREPYELMCHPGFMPEEEDIRGWAYRHEEELQALTSPLIRSEIAARNIQLCSFKNLMNS